MSGKDEWRPAQMKENAMPIEWRCEECGKLLRSQDGLLSHLAQKHGRKDRVAREKRVSYIGTGDVDYSESCQVCGAVPTMHPLGLCGPCATGESDTRDGNW